MTILSWSCSCGEESGTTWASYKWGCAARSARRHVTTNGVTDHEVTVNVLEGLL